MTSAADDVRPSLPRPEPRPTDLNPSGQPRTTTFLEDLVIQLPAPIEHRVFDTQAPKLIKYLGTVPTAKAQGLVAEVYDQMRREFQLVPPVTLHAPNPELLAGVWGMLRETIVAGPRRPSRAGSGLRSGVADQPVQLLRRCPQHAAHRARP
jgi:hypothetical protein